MKEEMVSQIKKFLVEGQTDSDIKGFLLASEVSPGKVAGIIRAAWEGIVSDADIDPDSKKAWCLEALKDIYRRMLSTGDYAGAKAAIKEIVAISDFKKAAPTPSEEKPKSANGNNISWPKFKTSNTRRK